MNIGKNKFRRYIGVLGFAFVFASPVQAAYPSQPVKMVVGFSAGSSIDLVARAVADQLSDKLGESVIVENKPGAGGNIAASYVARADDNGHTLLVIANSIAISPALYKDLGFDPRTDLQPVAYVGIGPVDLKVNTKVGVNSLDELIDYAKENPGKLDYSSSGVGGTPHMATVYFQQVTGTQLTHIPYKGGGDAMAALMGGQVDLLINPLLGTSETEGIKTLAITGDDRSKLAPDVPTFKELGYPKFDIGVYYGIMGPAGMPVEVVDQLNNAVNEVLDQEKVKERLTDRYGVVLEPRSVGEFKEFLENDMQRWETLVQDTGITID